MMFSVRAAAKVNSRHLSKYVHKDTSAKAVRQKFLDYFVNKNHHNFVKSSPVVPFCDPSVAFVNAGMNQFKNVFLGNQEAPFKKVANSQKCIRVGGKHNDIDIVGADGYHHTFFEMLGNWSFGDYFKKEACELAWKLLTEEYKINPARLYITYFKGDPKLDLDADLETKEIWKSLGVPEDRILAFSSKDNFWEMGAIGPCGPCTEIHIDHITSANRAKLVNKGLHDLTELWNIVFIQYNRNAENSIDLLPEKHVDTGMGFERLTAVLQGKISNYDTDNFSYLFKAIHKNCSGIPKYEGRFGENDWDSLDMSYRILADHTRMITACLADGMIPETNQKLRRIMRKAFLLSETVFKKEEGLLKELSNYVIEQLGSVYKEMEYNAKQIHQIIDYEEDTYKTIRKTAAEEWKKIIRTNKKLESLDVLETPSLVAACREIESVKPKSIDAELGFKLYDSFGLDFETISKLAKTCELDFDENELHDMLDKAKLKSKRQSLLNNNIIAQKLNSEKLKKTEVLVYDYDNSDGKYNFPNPNVNVLKILHNSEFVPEIAHDTKCFVLLDKSNFYTESGGQISDKGSISFENNSLFNIVSTQNCNGYIMHEGCLKSGTLKLGDSGILSINTDYRLNNMKNHTATHLLNAVVKEIKGATCQKSSKVTDQYLNLDIGIFSDKFSLTEIENIERKVRELINKKLPVKTQEIDSQTLLTMDYVTLIPGEIYPDQRIRLIEVVGPDGFISREPCCGTHVLCTSDLEDFSIINVKSLGRSTISFDAVTSDRARIAKTNYIKISNEIKKLESCDPLVVSKKIQLLREKLSFNIEDSNIIPYVTKQQSLETLNKLSKTIRDSNKDSFKELIEEEMQKALATNILKTKNNQKYMIHYVKTPTTSEKSVSLQKATRLCPDIPVLVILYCDNVVKARCCVPEPLKNKSSFSAEKWLTETVVDIFKSKAATPKGQDGNLVCNMKGKRISSQDLDALLKKSVDAAKKYVEERL